MDTSALKEKADIYKLFANLLAKEPTAELLQLLQQKENKSLFKSYKIDLFSDIKDLSLGQQVESLAVEYARLFLMPPKLISLHESVQLGEGKLWGNATVEVNKIYKKFGFELDPSFKDMPDHLSVELAFLAQLSELEFKYANEGLTKAKKGLQEVKSFFLENHLLKWFPNIKDKIKQHAKFSYYREIVNFLGIFLSNEWEDLKDVKEGIRDV